MEQSSDQQHSSSEFSAPMTLCDDERDIDDMMGQVDDDDDFLMLMDDMGGPSVTDDHFDHHERQEPKIQKLPEFYRQDDDMSPPHSPVPNEINIYGPIDVAHRVTPEQASTTVHLPDATELQLQYKRTLKKLATSMRRSDATRTMVKRQRSATFSVGSGLSEEDLSGDFFCGPRGAQVEQSRRNLMKLISHQS